MISDDGHLPALAWLLARGFDLLARDRRGLTVLESRGPKHPAAVALLERQAVVVPRGAAPSRADRTVLAEIGTTLGLAARQAAEDSGDLEANADREEELRDDFWERRHVRDATSILRKTPALASLDETAALAIVLPAFEAAWSKPRAAKRAKPVTKRRR